MLAKSLATTASILSALLAPTVSSAAVILYDSPAQTFITGINGLVVSGLGTFDVSFEVGSFDDVYGASTTTADLTIDTRSDASSAAAAIIATLNTVTSDGDLGGELFSPTPFTEDAFLIPYFADATFSARLVSDDIDSDIGLWRVAGAGLLQDRASTLNKVMCSTCTPAKFAVFTEAAAAAVPSPGSLWLLGLGLVGLLRSRIVRA